MITIENDSIFITFLSRKFRCLQTKRRRGSSRRRFPELSTTQASKKYTAAQKVRRKISISCGDVKMLRRIVYLEKDWQAVSYE